MAKFSKRVENSVGKGEIACHEQFLLFLHCFQKNHSKVMAKFSKRVENSVGKGEIARHKQLLLFPHCFQKTCTTDM